MNFDFKRPIAREPQRESHGGLLDQHKLLNRVILTKGVTLLDVKVFSAVLNRFYRKYDQSMTSLRFLEAATGASRTNIIKSVRRLIDLGAIHRIRKGRGTRPTEYGIHFNFGKPSSPSEETANSDNAERTATGHVDGTTTATSGDSLATESYLRSRSTDRPTEGRDCATAVPSAPPAAGLTPGVAGPAVVVESEQDARFNELWAACWKKLERSKAKDAYRQLNPDAALHALMMAKVYELTKHYADSGTERRYQKYLHNWIREERYHEDVPQSFAAANDNPHVGRRGSRIADTSTRASNTPRAGIHKIEIVAADIANGPTSASHMTLRNRICGMRSDAAEFIHSFPLATSDEFETTRGQEIFASLRAATGIASPKHASEFVGLKLRAKVQRDGEISYAA